ncbi:MAG TPA: N-succinylarginine dihydrolase [Fibrobacteria bacterium]|nr:N-succinylarginine dihydrolase [Fibrobacteria bacterium]
MNRKPSPAALEANFDGLVGPTHNYAGLAHGNVASQANKRKPANPRQAALQGLEKMRRVAALGVAQAVLPPQDRPDIAWLRRLGFSGSDGEVLAKAAKADPVLLASCYSASAMWTANAATVSPSADSADGRVHFTPANLASQLHRSVEPPHTAALLRKLFPGPRFAHHDPLPPGRFFGDEGAANHIRLAPSHGAPGLQVFVYGLEAAASAGRAGGRAPPGVTRRFLPRQSVEASIAVARLHRLDPGRAVFLEQNPAAVDAGVFHNDVISVGNGNLLFCHQAAFKDQAEALQELRRSYAVMNVGGLRGRQGEGGSLRIIEVKSREVPLDAAVATYLFNSQILTLPDGGTLLLAAAECRRDPRTRKYLEALPGRGLGITRVEFADLRQSMRNGGGPACLRLRVALTEKEWMQVPAGVKFGEALYGKLKAWVEEHYRDRLLPKDLADPSLPGESRAALAGIYRILGMAAPGP